MPVYEGVLSFVHRESLCTRFEPWIFDRRTKVRGTADRPNVHLKVMIAPHLGLGTGEVTSSMTMTLDGSHQNSVVEGFKCRLKCMIECRPGRLLLNPVVACQTHIQNKLG